MNDLGFIEFRVEVPLKVVWDRPFNTQNFENLADERRVIAKLFVFI